MKRRALLLQLLIVFSISCLAASLPFLASSLLSANTSKPPARLPPPPDLPEQILAIQVGGFYGGHLLVRTIAGETLAFGIGIEEHPWQPPGENYSAQDEPCSRTNKARLEAGAGLIVDCRQAQLIGEWCPGPEVSYAIDSDRTLWELHTNELCYPLLIPLSTFIGVVFAVGGLAFVAVGYFLDTRKRIRTSANCIAA